MTHKKKAAILGVIFPKVEKFINDYLASIEGQTNKDFDLIIINDGFNNFDNFKAKYKLNIKELKYRGTPAKIREFGINYIKNEGYEHIIFTDSDDFFSSNRVEKSIELLRYYDMVVNDLTIVSNNGNILNSRYISNRLRNLSKINLDFIRDKNIFGFSNTAIRSKCLRGNITFDKNLIAVDWYLFSIILKEDFSAIFTNEAVTFYRIYEDNTIGLSSDINREKTENIIAVKLSHYKNLSEIDARYKYLYTKFDELKKGMANSKYVENYIKKIKYLKINRPLWWEEIKLPEELSL